MTTDFERLQSDNTSKFLKTLREESGHTNGCPICGSGAWSHEDMIFGYCQDCGFDLITATSISYAAAMNQATDFYQGKYVDPRDRALAPDRSRSVIAFADVLDRLGDGGLAYNLREFYDTPDPTGTFYVERDLPIEQVGMYVRDNHETDCLPRIEQMVRDLDVLPPIVVRETSENHYSALDGYHRLHAHTLAGRATIAAFEWIDLEA